MGVHFITTDNGEELVIMSRRDYDALLAQLGDEDAEDRMTLRIAEQAREEASLPSEVSAKIMRGQSLLSALREWRGLSLSELSLATGLDEDIVRALEARSGTISPTIAAKLAHALKISESWLP